MIQNRIFSRLPRVGKQWYLSFDLKPTGIVSSWSNILHLTIGKNIERFGDRIPGIWFHPGRTAIHITNAVNGNKNYIWDSKDDLALNTFFNVRVRQTWNQKLNAYELVITLNGEVVHRVVNNAAGDFENVLFYASDPWSKAAKAVIKNLVFQNLPNGKFSLYIFTLYTAKILFSSLKILLYKDLYLKMTNF